MQNMEPSSWSTPRGKFTLIGLTFINIVIQLVIAGIVKYSTTQSLTAVLVLAAVYAVVLALNVGRFVVWGIIHKRYPLGIAYASSALLFPSIVALSYYYGEPVTVQHLLGVAMVVIGVVSLVREA
jgi:multidrug transporter EmrE-like cation transporter